MEIIRCAKGHVYDAEKFPGGCPQCQKESGVYPSTTMDMGDIDATQPVNPGRNDAAAHGQNGGVQDYDDKTQPVNIGGVAGFVPVTGWLVSIEGPSRGRDYQIHAGYNYIGRGEDMDIRVEGDMKIGRERHAMIAYDSEERVFFFGPADGKSIVRVNGKMVMNATELSGYDVLTVGSTKLIFVPLCGETFNWED